MSLPVQETGSDTGSEGTNNRVAADEVNPRRRQPFVVVSGESASQWERGVSVLSEGSLGRCRDRHRQRWGASRWLGLGRSG